VMFGIDPVSVERPQSRFRGAGGPEHRERRGRRSRYVLDARNLKVLEFDASGGPARSPRSTASWRCRRRWRTFSAGRRTSSGPSLKTSGWLLSRGRSPPDRGVPRAGVRPAVAGVPSPLRSSRKTSGFPRSAKRFAKPSCWRERQRRRTSTRARLSFPSTGTSPST
jgi:hypothetical protein